MRKSYLIAFIGSATRFVPAAELRLSEGAADHEYVLKQALLKHKLPRAFYFDNVSERSKAGSPAPPRVPFPLVGMNGNGTIDRPPANGKWDNDPEDDVPFEKK